MKDGDTDELAGLQQRLCNQLRVLTCAYEICLVVIQAGKELVSRLHGVLPDLQKLAKSHHITACFLVSSAPLETQV